MFVLYAGRPASLLSLRLQGVTLRVNVFGPASICRPFTPLRPFTLHPRPRLRQYACGLPIALYRIGDPDQRQLLLALLSHAFRRSDAMLQLSFLPLLLPSSSTPSPSSSLPCLPPPRSGIRGGQVWYGGGAGEAWKGCKYDTGGCR